MYEVFSQSYRLDDSISCFLNFYEFSSFQGITVKIDERAELVIARILSGSMIDKQGRTTLLACYPHSTEWGEIF